MDEGQAGSGQKEGPSKDGGSEKEESEEEESDTGSVQPTDEQHRRGVIPGYVWPTCPARIVGGKNRGQRLLGRVRAGKETNSSANIGVWAHGVTVSLATCAANRSAFERSRSDP